MDWILLGLWIGFARQVLLDYGFNPAPASHNPNQLPLFNPNTFSKN